MIKYSCENASRKYIDLWFIRLVFDDSYVGKKFVGWYRK